MMGWIIKQENISRQQADKLLLNLETTQQLLSRTANFPISSVLAGQLLLMTLINHMKFIQVQLDNPLLIIIKNPFNNMSKELITLICLLERENS